jgi:nitrogen fixation protein NifX
VAVASQDGKALDAHFGYARKLMVYDVTPRAHRLVRAMTFASMGDDDLPEGEKIAAKVAALVGCDVLYALAIGPAAAARVIQADVHPVKLGTPQPIAAVIAGLQAMMTLDPPAWLRRQLTTAEKELP